MPTKKKYATVSIPQGIADAVDELIEKLGYWPSRGAFVREATLEKIRGERKRLERNPQVEEAPENAERREK